MLVVAAQNERLRLESPSCCLVYATHWVVVILSSDCPARLIRSVYCMKFTGIGATHACTTNSAVGLISFYSGPVLQLRAAAIRLTSRQIHALLALLILQARTITCQENGQPT
jgi:hypothetical protein